METSPSACHTSVIRKEACSGRAAGDSCFGTTWSVFLTRLKLAQIALFTNFKEKCCPRAELVNNVWGWMWGDSLTEIQHKLANKYTTIMVTSSLKEIKGEFPHLSDSLRVSLFSPLQGKVKDTCIFMEEPGTGSMAFNCFFLVGGGMCQHLLIYVSRGHSQSMTERPFSDWAPILCMCVCPYVCLGGRAEDCLVIRSLIHTKPCTAWKAVLERMVEVYTQNMIHHNRDRETD